jgi:uncharacterized protein with PIN domain
MSRELSELENERTTLRLLIEAYGPGHEYVSEKLTEIRLLENQLEEGGEICPECKRPIDDPDEGHAADPESARLWCAACCPECKAVRNAC